MAAPVLCPTCERGSRIPDALLGKTIRCPYCFDSFEATLDPNAPPQPEVVEELPAPVASTEPTPEPESEPILDADVVDELPVVQKEGPRFREFEFRAVIVADPYRTLRGAMRATVGPEGLRLFPLLGKEAVALAQIGSPCRYIGENRIGLTIQGREVQILVLQSFTQQNRLARDLAALLNGDKATFHPPEYSRLGLPLAASFLTLFIPILAAILGLVHGVLSFFAWTLICFMATVLGVMLALTVPWRPSRRLILVGSVVATGYLLVVGDYCFDLGPVKPIEWRDWRPIRLADGQAQMSFPGTPKAAAKTLNNQLCSVHSVDLPRHRASFHFAYVDMDLKNPTKEELTPYFRAYSDAIKAQFAPYSAIGSNPIPRTSMGYPGFFESARILRAGDNRVLIVEECYAQGRFYLQWAVVPDTPEQGMYTQPFFNSFDLKFAP